MFIHNQSYISESEKEIQVPHDTIRVIHCLKAPSDLSGHLLLSTSLKPPYVFHPFSLPVILQMLCLAVQLLTHPLENLCSSNFLSFPAGYQMEKKINHYCLKAYYTH